MAILLDLPSKYEDARRWHDLMIWNNSNNRKVVCAGFGTVVEKLKAQVAA